MSLRALVSAACERGSCYRHPDVARLFRGEFTAEEWFPVWDPDRSTDPMYVRAARGEDLDELDTLEDP